MSDWYGIKGRISRAAGTSGTLTLEGGARLVQVKAHASSGGGTVSIFGSVNIPMVSFGATAPWWELQENHLASVAGEGGAPTTIVFTGTDGYFVEYIRPAGTS